MYLMKCWWTIRLTCTWLCVQSLRNKFDEAKRNCQSCFLKHGRWKYYFGISNLWEAFPSGLKPLFQREAKCKAIDMKIIFDSHRNKTHFQNLNKDFAHSLVLKVKVFGIRKWPTPLETSCGGVCGRAVNTLNSGSGGPEFKPRTARSFLRQGNLHHFVSLYPGV